MNKVNQLILNCHGEVKKAMPSYSELTVLNILKQRDELDFIQLSDARPEFNRKRAGQILSRLYFKGFLKREKRIYGQGNPCYKYSLDN